MEKHEIRSLAIEKLKRGIYQPRRQFDEEELEELALSIRANGLIQPIVVRPLLDGGYEIIAGERRWRAAQRAGFDEVMCLVRNYSDAQAAAVTTIENVIRKDLNPIEEARAYQRLLDEFHYSHEEIAAVIGKSRAKITNMLRLLRLERPVQDYLITGQLSEGHGKLLAGLVPKVQTKLAIEAVQQAWSVRQLEQAVRKAVENHATETTPNDPNLQALERKISEQLGTPIKLDHNAKDKGGWLNIRYYDTGTLEGLLDKIGVKYE